MLTRPRTRDVNAKFLTGVFTLFLMFIFCECFYVRVLIPVLTAFCLFINNGYIIVITDKLTVHKEECQTPRR